METARLVDSTLSGFRWPKRKKFLEVALEEKAGKERREVVFPEFLEAGAQETPLPQAPERDEVMDNLRERIKARFALNIKDCRPERG